MQKGHAVLFDHSTIISASRSSEHYHKECRLLFDYLKKNPVGIVTQSIKDSVKQRVTSMPNLPPEDFQSLTSNLDMLRTEEIDYASVTGHLVKVQKFYNSLPPIIKEHIYLSKKEAEEKFQARMNNVPRIFRHCIKDCYRLQAAKEYPPYSGYVEKTLLAKFFDNPPSADDVMLLTEACQLKKRYDDVLIASTDQHLSPIVSCSGVVETFVTDLIEKEFQVKCNWPNAILQVLKKC